MPRIVFIVRFGLILWGIPAARVLAESPNLAALHADVSRSLLGDGTGVVIGFIDSGIDSTHPALGGVDSVGRPRLVAQQSFVSYEPGTVDDVAGHGTGVAGVALGRDPTNPGVAPDARYVNARVLDSSNSFYGGTQIIDAAGFAISHGADVLNLSLNFFTTVADGNSPVELMLDWASESAGVNVVVAAGNIAAHRDGSGNIVLDESPPTSVHSPGSGYNGLTVGRTSVTYDQVFVTSRSAPTTDGRVKPDVAAPGTAITVANANWESGPTFLTGINGTSFSAPQVSGLIAQQIEFGRAHSLNISPLVIKSTLVNSALPVLRKDATPWSPRSSSVVGGVLEVTSPLDGDSGAGQVDGLRLFRQYFAGRHGPGLVPATGWDLNSVAPVSSLAYTFGVDPADALGVVDITLDWFRHVTRTDNGDGVISDGDTFGVSFPLSNLDLSVFLDGALVAVSDSTIDNLEHLRFPMPRAGTVSIRVGRLLVPGESPAPEPFAIAWDLVRFGDANFDGVVNADDVAILDRGFAKRLTGWSNGDFNADGMVDAADYAMLYASLRAQEGASPDPAAVSAAVVPEPGMALCLFAPIARRRRWGAGSPAR